MVKATAVQKKQSLINPTSIDSSAEKKKKMATTTTGFGLAAGNASPSVGEFEAFEAALRAVQRGEDGGVGASVSTPFKQQQQGSNGGYNSEVAAGGLSALLQQQPGGAGVQSVSMAGLATLHPHFFSAKHQMMDTPGVGVTGDNPSVKTQHDSRSIHGPQCKHKCTSNQPDIPGVQPYALKSPLTASPAAPGTAFWQKRGMHTSPVSVLMIPALNMSVDTTMDDMECDDDEARVTHSRGGGA